MALVIIRLLARAVAILIIMWYIVTIATSMASTENVTMCYSVPATYTVLVCDSSEDFTKFTITPTTIHSERRVCY